jgi:hypothetical protein
VSFVASFVEFFPFHLSFTIKLATKLATKGGGAAVSSLPMPQNLFGQALIRITGRTVSIISAISGKKSGD